MSKPITEEQPIAYCEACNQMTHHDKEGNCDHIRELNAVVSNLALALSEAFHLPKIVDWLAEKLR